MAPCGFLNLAIALRRGVVHWLFLLYSGFCSFSVVSQGRKERGEEIERERGGGGRRSTNLVAHSCVYSLVFSMAGVSGCTMD